MGSGNNKFSTTNEPGEAGANQSNSEENIPSTSGKHAITYFFFILDGYFFEQYKNV